MKSILITGAGRGIGRAAALLCAARGWAVGINYRHDDASAAETARAVRAAGARCALLKGDVTQEADVESLFAAAEQALGPLDGVVINAGIVAPSMPVADMSVARLRNVFDTNILGAFLCAREAARRLPTHRGGSGGSIVLVSSTASRIGSPYEFVDYAASKAAVDTLGLGLSKELARDKVRVNVVRPGLIDTEFHVGAGQPDRAVRIGATTPIGRPGRAEEIGEAIVWLLSDASSYATGAIIDVAGGR